MKLTRLALLMVLGVAGACGGGGGGDADGGPPPGPDAGPDAAPMALGHDALGAYNGARMIAVWEESDAVLYRVTGDYLVMGGRECDPAVNYSFWTFTFLSPGTGVAIDVIYSMGTYTKFTRTENPEGKRLFTTEWIGSIEAVDTIAQIGYTDQPVGDMTWRTGATLEMYGGADPNWQAIPSPIWRVSKIHAPPGMPTETEEWLVTYWEEMGGHLVCDPAGMCSII